MVSDKRTQGTSERQEERSVQNYSADLEIVSPLSHAVAFGDLWLEHGHVAHGSGQTGDGLSSTASNSHK